VELKYQTSHSELNEIFAKPKTLTKTINLNAICKMMSPRQMLFSRCNKRIVVALFSGMIKPLKKSLPATTINKGASNEHAALSPIVKFRPKADTEVSYTRVLKRYEKDERPILLKELLEYGKQNGDFTAVSEECDRRLSAGERIDKRQLTTMIRAFGSAGQVEKVLHCKFVVYVICVVCIINCFFAVLEHVGRDPEIHAKLDEFHFSAAIHACGASGSWKQAMVLFENFRMLGLPSNKYVYAATMAALVKAGQYTRALEIFDEMQSTGAKIDRTAYNVALNAASKSGQHVRCLLMFSKMKDFDIKPDIVSCLAVLVSCELAGDWKEALELLDVMTTRRWLRPTTAVYTTVVSACVKGRIFSKALELISMICRKSGRNATESDESDGDITSHLLDDVSKRRAPKMKKIEEPLSPPDQILFSLGIAACVENAEYAPIAVSLLNQMIESKMKPTYICFSNTLKSLSLSPRNDEKCIEIYCMGRSFGYFQELSCLNNLGDNSPKIYPDIYRIVFANTESHVIPLCLKFLFKFFSDNYIDKQKLPKILFLLGRQYVCGTPLYFICFPLFYRK
jgi:pentatricopeptide repeat protein